MKKLIFLMLFSACFAMAKAQTTATNFTQYDCNSNIHDLFTELDAGKVVVMVWVMPCSSCIGPAKTAFNVANSYSGSHPGVVRYYLIDDYGNSNCSVVSGWGSTNNIFPDAVFSNSAISMSSYGSDGMPKIVIVGGLDHKVYFNENNANAGNSTALQNAMNLALNVSTGVKKEAANNNRISVFPNPAVNETKVSFYNPAVADVNIELFNLTGSKVYSASYLKQAAGFLTYEIQLGDLPKGVYYLNVNGIFQKLSIQ